MSFDASGDFDPQHVRRWWEITRNHLLADFGGAATKAARLRRKANEMTARIAQMEAGQTPLIAPGMDEPRLRAELAAWAHRQALRLLREAAWAQTDPLRVLERVLRLQLAFVARHPAGPARLMAGLVQTSDPHARDRIGNAIGHYEARLARLIERAQRGRAVAAAVDAHAAARLLVALLQGLLLQMRAGRHGPEQLRGEAARLLSILLNGLRGNGERFE